MSIVCAAASRSTRLKSSSCQDDELALLVLVALDDLLPRNFLPVGLGDPLVVHRALVRFTQEPESSIRRGAWRDRGPPESLTRPNEILPFHIERMPNFTRARCLFCKLPRPGTIWRRLPPWRKARRSRSGERSLPVSNLDKIYYPKVEVHEGRNDRLLHQDRAGAPAAPRRDARSPSSAIPTGLTRLSFTRSSVRGRGRPS